MRLEEKHVKFFVIVVVIGLVVSLVMNVRMFSRLDQIENQVHSVSNYQQQLMSSVNDQTNHIRNVMDDIKQEQSWISDIMMDVNTETADKNQAELNFEWQVKELHENAEVVFNYSFGDDDTYTTLPAEEIQNGLFEVSLPIEVDMQPRWEVGSIPTGGDQEQAKRIIEEKRMKENQQRTLNYFVTMSYDDIEKSGRVQTDNLGYIGTSRYGIIQTDVNMHNGNYSFHLFNHPTDGTLILEEATLLKYEAGSLIEEIPFEPEQEEQILDPHQPRFFHLNQIESEDDVRFVIKVIYSNGDTFEKEIL